MCSPARVVDRYGHDVSDQFAIPYLYNVPGPGGVYLGSVGDQDHQTRKSSHNCAPMQESPVNGVAYHPDFAHAWDCRPRTRDIGLAMVRATLGDPRVRYINFDDVRYFPDGRTESTDHPTFHVSFLPGTHDDTRPFFTEQGDDLVGETADKILNHVEDIDRKTPGVEQQKRDRAKATATARTVRASADLLVEVAEAVNADKKVDALTLKLVRENRDKLALLLADEDDDGTPTEGDT